MPNERLRDAMHRKRLTPGDLAVVTGVDPKTVERWITRDRIPYPRHRYALAAHLGETQTYLWPDALLPGRAAEVSESELIQIYSRRVAVPVELWRRLLTTAGQQISILVYAGLFLPEQHPNLVAILRERAESGARVRILLGDPDSPEVAQRGADEGIGDAISAKIRNVLAWYGKLDGVEGVSLGLHRTTLYNSIYQFDDEMLVNPHVFGFPAAHAPTLHLRRLAGGDLFNLYADSFDRIWSTARPLREHREAL
ncbi:XRE family transcriptional regulator [Micromonospora sp. NBC_01699]|uniref:helix-turn-helix transcriptional regulator n=1 Tax=Micromonospora sp. NBC_01699 TaxID=2975984 RepID=UPI002E2D7FE1|nr:helix-turn-helix transcriptional regulator [Micromonospora sp. NBC_01699]